MKKVYSFILITVFSASVFGQGFKGNISVAAGIINAKIRSQFEYPIKNRGSFGLNLSYYFIPIWRGPVFEPFIRLYAKKNGNEQGFLFQFKACYGILTNNENSVKMRGTTGGFGLGIGYKYLVNKHFTVEQTLGIRFLTAPNMVYFGPASTPNKPINIDAALWYLSSGFPIEYNLKFGYQFCNTEKQKKLQRGHFID